MGIDAFLGKRGAPPQVFHLVFTDEELDQLLFLGFSAGCCGKPGTGKAGNSPSAKTGCTAPMPRSEVSSAGTFQR
jgi:hypothetical protein